MNDLLTKVDVPEGQSGPWKVERFEVSEEEARLSALRAMFSFGGGGVARAVPSGEYTRLMCGRSVVMSDTPAEFHDHTIPVIKAHGQVLVAGLGLGVVLQGILRKDAVEHVTVVEKSKDVINLVANHYFERFGQERLTVVHEDIFKFRSSKETFWNVAWFDIWNTLCADNLKAFTKLKRKFPPRKCGWRGFWGEILCRRLTRR